MRGSVMGVMLQPCCKRTLREIADALEKGGVDHTLFSVGSLSTIINPNPPTGAVTVSAAEWNMFDDEVGNCEEDDKDTCEQLATVEFAKHTGQLGMFWRSLADCCSSAK